MLKWAEGDTGRATVSSYLKEAELNKSITGLNEWLVTLNDYRILQEVVMYPQSCHQEPKKKKTETKTKKKSVLNYYENCCMGLNISIYTMTPCLLLLLQWWGP